MRIPIDRLLAAVVVFALGTALPVTAHALNVFACEPEWAALVRVIAPDAHITAATHAHQDPHHIEARPALISGLRRADLAVCTGASLEVGWLPVLQQRAANPAIQVGQPGMFFTSEGVELIDRPARLDRSMGDVHAEGNPHFHLDPERLKRVAQELVSRLAQIDPPNATLYRDRHRQWEAHWSERISDWKARAAPLAGNSVIAEHSGFAYLWRWLEIRQTADLEPVPGIPPTLAHLQAVLSLARATPPFAVVQSLYQDPQAGRWLVDRIEVPLLTLPSTVTAKGAAADLDGLFDTLINELLKAEGQKPK